MTPRNTRTGKVLEDTVLPALGSSDYTFAPQVDIGQSVSGGRHIVDVVITRKDGSQTLLSLKWQQTSGTAEEKVPYEVIKLIHAIKTSAGRFTQAYLLLGGPGWSKREFYIANGLRNYIVDHDLVKILTLEDFLARVNRNAL